MDFSVSFDSYVLYSNDRKLQIIIMIPEISIMIGQEAPRSMIVTEYGETGEAKNIGIFDLKTTPSNKRIMMKIISYIDEAFAIRKERMVWEKAISAKNLLS